jgi:hypothetical protein
MSRVARRSDGMGSDGAPQAEELPDADDQQDCACRSERPCSGPPNRRAARAEAFSHARCGVKALPLLSCERNERNGDGDKDGNNPGPRPRPHELAHEIPLPSIATQRPAESNMAPHDSPLDQHRQG